ncbi:3-deoxy-8-phosphooctulonate synthase [Flavobacteriaceae bacterium]|jgi:2-dehydro-3-deoxyphosphooctonate aldolase (KDO 8-P synthase)|nr:3-deoxy-8-phosphooctulonate synthase [Flavobacteriaceae bacterium]MDB4180440.1 3-deoxy-8-phosphooctulonate synthase [Flavobacteriaceae bacterium]MDC0497215.1 3-deoxy-8-phosphooctulonate synthase [Flavobacteriaceae bacterium]MDC1320726.1 3-deoxy-8-phosphooctulonate synthase [Flavobacteriaceae bacterium]
MNIPKLKHLNSDNFILIAGPCAIEGEEMAFKIAEKILKISNKYKVPFIFKGSFKKANRSRIDSFTGIGDVKALEILRKVSSALDVPTITDIHEVKDAELAAKYVDVLQIPAFLVRQTDLVVAAAKTGKIVNLKKGQFMSPESMKHAVQKVKDSNNKNVLITDRGTMFGYQDMIVDFRGIPTMKSIAPTILDVTHSLQKPNQTSGVTGGVPHMIETIARAGVVNNIDGLFIETHFDPKNAKSDGANMLDLNLLESLISNLVEIRKTINKF